MSEINFEVLIPKENLNHFFNILQFLGKIGKDVIFEVDVEMITLRSLNDAKSAFASVELAQDYFQFYELRSPQNESFACKMAVKPLCSVLKNSKKMQSLKLSNSRQETGELEMIFTMSCSHGILRTHRFIYQDTDIVNAMFDDSSPTCSRVRCEPKVLAQLFTHIHHRVVGEVSIDISRTSFKVKTFHSDRNRSLNLNDQSMASIMSSSSGKSRMTTEMCLDPRNEFDQFDFRNPENSQEIILCCKEIKSLLWLSEASEIGNLNLLFTEGGRPIKFNCELLPNLVNVTLIMATLEPRITAENDYETQQSLTNGTGDTFTGRELRAELDEEEEAENERGIVTPLRDVRTHSDGTDEERTQPTHLRTPTTPLSTTSSRSRGTHSSSSSKRKFHSHHDVPPTATVGEERPLHQSLRTPQKSRVTPPKSSGGGGGGGGEGSASQMVGYLGGMSRLRKMIMDEEEE